MGASFAAPPAGTSDGAGPCRRYRLRRERLGRAALLVVAVLLACDAREAPPLESAGQAITGGVEDAGDPAVVALLAGGHVTCSGVLVAPRLVITAGHCLLDDRPTAVFFRTWPDAAGATVPVAAVTLP